jgi:hypothetical protein
MHVPMQGTSAERCLNIIFKNWSLGLRLHVFWSIIEDRYKVTLFLPDDTKSTLWEKKDFQIGVAQTTSRIAFPLPFSTCRYCASFISRPEKGREIILSASTRAELCMLWHISDSGRVARFLTRLVKNYKVYGLLCAFMVYYKRSWSTYHVRLNEIWNWI